MDTLSRPSTFVIPEGKIHNVSSSSESIQTWRQLQNTTVLSIDTLDIELEYIMLRYRTKICFSTAKMMVNLSTTLDLIKLVSIHRQNVFYIMRVLWHIKYSAKHYLVDSNMSEVCIWQVRELPERNLPVQFLFNPHHDRVEACWVCFEEVKEN